MLFSVCLTSAGCTPTTLSSWGCGDKGPSEMYSSVHPEVSRVSSSSQPLAGEESLFWRMDEGGRVMIFSFFFPVCLFLFFLNLYRGFIAVLKYVRSYLHSLGLVTETNKNNILLRCFSVKPGLYSASACVCLTTCDHQVSLQHLHILE